MNTLISLLGAPLGHVMRWCYGLLGSYGPAILLFTLITKVILLPVADRHKEACEKVLAQLDAAGLRAEIDRRSEKLGYKLREAQLQKIPYMLVVGDKEAEDGTVSVRKRGAGDQGSMSVSDFVALANADVDSKAIW